MTTARNTKTKAEEPEETLAEAVGEDIATLAPEPGVYTMTNGVKVNVKPLKTRELLKFLKILTRGAGPLLQTFNFSSNDAGEFGQRLVVLAVMSIPEAEDEALEFIQFIVEPDGLIERPRLTKADQERNETLWESLYEVIENPDIEDTIGIITAMILAEKDNIASLVKKIQAMMTTLGVDLNN